MLCSLVCSTMALASAGRQLPARAGGRRSRSSACVRRGGNHSVRRTPCRADNPFSKLGKKLDELRGKSKQQALARAEKQERDAQLDKVSEELFGGGLFGKV